MKQSHLSLGLGALLCLGTLSVHAEEAASVADFFAKGDAGLDLRYRLEYVDQDGFAKEALASTLLTKLWYKTAVVHGVSGYLEVTNVTAVGGSAYNSTINGKTAYPVVPDPDSTEVNQAYLQYKQGWFSLKGGRQGINLDDQRFIGTVGWRQNDQTYDAVTATLTPAKDLKATYGYIWNVNRIFGDDHPLGDLQSDSHIFNVSYGGLGFGKLSAYAYLMDVQTAGAVGLSSQTYGARFAGATAIGKGLKLGYQAEYASQSDYKSNPGRYSADFWHLGASLSGHGLTGGVDYELLGADAGGSFKTPFATLHKFNGWADKFLATPAAGLKDVYGTLAYKLPAGGAFGGTLLKAVYHDFKADTGGAHYGSEWDFLAAKKVTKYLQVVAKAAFYHADSFGADTTKLWLMLAANF